MARKTTAQLSTSFVDGATVSGSNFADIFDSNFNLQDTGTSVASGSLNVLTDITASAFKGDGSALTSVSAFPFTGDAVITGSFSVTASSGQTDSLIDVAGHLIVEASGIVTASNGMYVSKSDATSDHALLDIAGHLIVESTGIVTAKQGAVISGSLTVSGSSVDFTNSTGVSGSFSGNGAGLTNLPSSSPFPLSGSAIISSSFTAGDSNSNTLKVIGSGSVSGSGILEFKGKQGTLFSSVDTLSGSLMSVTDISGLPILEVFSDNSVLANNLKTYRPIQTQESSFVLQLTDAGYYHRCHGAITASISASSAIPFALGTEIEFIQTSSAGNLYITASAGTVITLNSKNDNLKLAGQWSAATIKKVGTNEWDIIGDLT